MLSLGRFVVEEEIARSVDSIEFVCSDLESTNKYILRIPVTAEIAELTLGNRDHLLSDIGYFRQQYGDLKFKRARHIYGVLDNRYLIQVSDPYVNANTASIQYLLSICPSNDLYLFALWETIALQMMSEAHDVDEYRMTKSEWENRWAVLSGGAILVSAITEYLENGDLSRTEKLRIIARVSTKSHDKPELAENILLRLVGAVTRERIVPECLIETLQCGHFRRNVTAHEVLQMSKALELLENSFNKGGLDATWIQLVLGLLDTPPATINKSPEKFVFQPDKPSLDQIWYLESLE